MQGSDDRGSEGELPGPPDGAQPVAPVFAPEPSPEPVPRAAPSPELARSESSERPAPTERERSRGVTATTPPPTDSAAAGAGREVPYRTDRDRRRSVNRLANPWYRRLARGLIGMAFLAAGAFALYFGAQFVRDFLDRDQLPEEAAEVPTVRSTTIEIRSTTPAPVLDGTLVLDTVTGSFEFVGRGTGSQAGMQVVSPDGVTTYVRRDATAWQEAPAGDRLAADVLLAVEYLRDDDSADDILTRPLRRNYVDLIERTEIGEGDDVVYEYEMRFDTAAFQENFPLEYADFEDRAIPGVAQVRGLLITITVDGDQVLVRVDDANTNWSWQRLSYSDQAFVPIDPSVASVTDSVEVDG